MGRRSTLLPTSLLRAYRCTRKSAIHIHGISPFGATNSLLAQSGGFTIPQSIVVSSNSGAISMSASAGASATMDVSADSGTTIAGDITGVIDGIYSAGDGSYYIAGWACVKYSEQSISVHLYLGGPAGSGTIIGGYAANSSSEPAVAASCQANGSAYRFQIPIAQSTASQYSGQAIYVHGINPSNYLGNMLLVNSGVFKVP